jgi:hypothetical protein
VYQLVWPNVDKALVLRQYSKFLDIDAVNQWKQYKELSKQHVKLGELKTLNTLEAYLFYLLMDKLQPYVLIEIGTLQGKSTRRLIDIRNAVSKDTKIICYDVVDKLHYINKDEVVFHQTDITGKVSETLNQYNGGIIYLDAHPYDLTLEVILEVLQQHKHWHLVIHDCAKHLCNPKMEIPKNRPDLITSLTGHWERHILAEVRGVSDPLDDWVNKFETLTHKFMVFDTLHGICAIKPK